MRSYRSVIGGNAGYDKHEVEGDDEFNHEGLEVWARWKCSCELVVRAGEEKSESSTCKRGSKHLR